MSLNDAASAKSKFEPLAGGALSELMRTHDWSASPLGPPETWPQSLRSSLRTCLGSQAISAIYWGPEFRLFYNDAYRLFLGERHPWALGRPMSEIWPTMWQELTASAVQVFETGQGIVAENQRLMMERDGKLVESYWFYSFAPIFGDTDQVEGIYLTALDTTVQVFAERSNANESQRMTRLFEQAPGFIAILRGPDHVFEFTNASYQRLVGGRESNGKPVREVLPELDGQGYYELLDRVYATKERFVADRTPIQLDLPGRGTTERILNFIYEPILGDDGQTTGIFVEGHDVTDAYRAETELRESEERNRRIVEGVKDHSIFTVDAEGRIADWTPGAEAIFGWSADAIKGESADLLFTPEDRAAGVPSLELATARKHGCANDERWHLRHDGSRFFANGSVRLLHDGQGEITGFIKIARDETERRQAEERLALSEEQLRLATDIGEIGEWDVDNLTGAMFWPPRVKAMFGISPDVPVTLDDFHNGVHPEDQEKTRTAYEAASDPDRRAFYDVEYRTVGKEDGRVRWVAAKGRGLFDADGVCFRVIGTAIDVTERKADEERLRELNDNLESRVVERTAELAAAHEQLRQAQKMEAVGQLTGGLAHDFNNLLAGISGSLELMQIRIAQGRMGDVERYVQAAQGAAKRAAALTHRLLAFSRRQTLAPKPTDVVRLVGGMEDLISRTVGPAIEIEMVNAAGLWPSLIDPSQLENAVLNLCINARDAMPDGGKITIETGNRWMDQRGAEQRGLDPGQYISLCVSDTGTGMLPEVVAKAFDPFFTTKPIGMGTGLGLSMIYGFAKQSGGSVGIYSEPGDGTMVCIYLPRHLGDAAAAEPLIDPDQVPRAMAGETVLVVDDEPTVRMLVGEVLTDLGYTAIEAADGPAGLKVINSDLRIDLLITDVGLPGGMNGRQVADAARVVRPGLKVLFITGYAENAVLSHGHLDPGMHVVTKPFAIDALANRIRELIEE